MCYSQRILRVLSFICQLQKSIGQPMNAGIGSLLVYENQHAATEVVSSSSAGSGLLK